MKKQVIICLSIIFVYLLVFGGFVQAQEEEDSSEIEFMLEEVTVTAQKRKENQQKVPIAMEVISGEGLTELGVDNIDELLFEVSNVMINTGLDGMRVTLRGISDEGGNFQNMQTSEPTVAVNIDGSYNNMNNAGQNMFDVERVEVLFGPQSTMYASNTPGGIVNVVTASPKINKYSANASVQYGTFDSYNLQAAVNAPSPFLKDKIALRAAASQSKTGTWSTLSDDQESTSVRLKALYQATDDFAFNVTGTWSKVNRNGRMGGTVVPFGDQDEVDDPWTESADDGLGTASNSDRITKGLSADISWDTKFGAISLVPAYSESLTEGEEAGQAGGAPPGGGGGGPPPGQATATTEINSYGTTSSTQKELELRLVSPKSFTWFTWIVGGSYYSSEQERTRDFYSEDSVDQKMDADRESNALFANITVPIPYTNNKLRGTVGYRQSWDETAYHEVSAGTIAGTVPSSNIKKHSAPDWKYGFEYDLADNMMLYGNYASSYRMGGYLQNAAKGNETLKSYTAGLKSRFWDNKLQVNVSAFFYDYTNRVVRSSSLRKDTLTLNESEWGLDFNADGVIEDVDVDVDPESGGQQGQGDFESIGVDLQTNWVITGQDRLNLSISYLDSTWSNLVFEYSWPEVWPTENYDGVTNIKSPKWSVSSGYMHNFMLGAFGSLSTEVQMQYKSSYTLLWNSDDDPYGYGYQEPYAQFNANATFNHSSGKWSLSANVKNITNYAAKSSFTGAGGQANSAQFKMRISDPRTYSAVFSIKF